LTGGKRGFSLVEALVAAAILLLICLSVTGTVLATMDARSVLDRRLYLEQAADAERVRLTALPYVRPVLAPIPENEWRASETSLVAEVFPHAQPEYNNGDASFGADQEGALFVTRALRDGVTLERTARFVRRTPSNWVRLSMADLPRWAMWESRPPATTLEITLVATQDGRSVTRLMRVTALAPILPFVTSRAPLVSR
jgi:type II secretory pathway pseudopilin PulG